LYGRQTLNEFKLQNIPKAGGITIAIMLSTSIGQQENWKIGKRSKAQSSLQNIFSLMKKFKKSLTRNVDLGSL